ncbi:Gfo/Idh/MocA family oxidoreductase [Mitsuaria sp. GD03876]|uniref:Gfo/Idh/MocA family protein n=1 Tax=Mitsuaria sp. GD03876 TaxID=2975399 RepID=UPI002449DCB7|nr:Gfo/Idh/MocA family oxidoreductase [Mitsuaria sp. GD03876]MDH0866939.1 Gfo/Idh/MocA family oxidoreductase [Mitsuaria sp. GD03876]
MLSIGVVGLGVMGQRMLARLAGHARLRVTRVWDENPEVLARALAHYPLLRAATGAEALIREPGLHGLYIATPPGPHIALTERAFDAGLAVLCEKPLTTDFAAARACIERIGREQRRAAVNYSLASSTGLAQLQLAFGAASRRPLGALNEVSIELRFAAWPRPWQAGAGAWLSQRAEGGFAREVLSHFIFVLQRVLGPAQVVRSQVDYPEDGIGSERALEAELVAAGVPVTIRASLGGDRADDNRMLWRASEGEIELRDWFGVTQQRQGERVQSLGDAETLRMNGMTDQLYHWAAMLEGRSHSLPGFAEALAVQTTIEALLVG